MSGGIATEAKAISASEKMGLWQHAFLLLAEMETFSHRPDALQHSSLGVGGWVGIESAKDVISFNGAISACAKAGEWQLALAMLEARLGR